MHSRHLDDYDLHMLSKSGQLEPQAKPYIIGELWSAETALGFTFAATVAYEYS
jgi:hypothetical protein